MTTGLVFNIQHFSIHDGPGIRSVVFLKGCPLKCAWCANPESQKFKTEAGWTAKDCIGCGACVNELGALSCRFSEGQLYWDTNADPGSASADIEAVCPTKAFHCIGRKMSVDEVLNEVEKDLKFYENSKGGMTLSGGEPLAQGEFALELLAEAKRRHIHCSIETCGCVSSETFKKAVMLLDSMYMDIKVMDEKEHIKWTGASNRQIIANLLLARQMCPELPIRVRTPIIPGVNDSRQELSAIIDLVHEAKADYEVLKYHRLGLSKYESLHREYPMGDVTLSDEKFKELEEYVKSIL